MSYPTDDLQYEPNNFRIDLGLGGSNRIAKSGGGSYSGGGYGHSGGGYGGGGGCTIGLCEILAVGAALAVAAAAAAALFLAIQNGRRRKKRSLDLDSFLDIFHFDEGTR